MTEEQEIQLCRDIGNCVIEGMKAIATFNHECFSAEEHSTEFSLQEDIGDLAGRWKVTVEKL